MDNGSAGEDKPAQPTVRQGVGGSGSRRRRAGRAPLKESEKMWVASTILLILFLVLSPQLFVFLPYFILDMPYTPARTLFTLAKLLIPFNIGAALILINYYKCVTMDPGSPPQDWKPPHEVLSTIEAPRSCRTCKGFKPPRAHHCRTCKRCVLRMDHHCPWIANCVGHHNYASFIRFLAAVDVTCAYHLVLCTLRIADHWWTNEGAVWRRPGNFTMTILVLNFCLCIPTFLLVGSFSLYHFWCLCTNTTTIEGWEKDKVETLISKRRIEEIDYPFDLGVMRNIQSVLGASPLHWCIPSTSCGTGLVYETGQDIEHLEQYAWPPRDPRRDARGHKTKKAGASSAAFTYGNNDFNPALRPGNQTSLRAAQKSAVPPWHPDFGKREDDDDEDPDEDAAQAAGVDTGESCVPPNTLPGSRILPRRAKDEESSSSGSSSEEESAVTMTKSRVRRGSEGYEVRPKRYDVASAALRDGSYDDHSNEDDDEEEEDDDLDDKIWEWRRQQEEEDRLRAMLEEEMRKSGPVTMHDPPADWSHDQMQGDVSASSSVLLPSQVMRRRSQWQQYLADGSPSRLVDEAGESEGSRT